MNYLVIGSFCACLLGCVITKISILYAMFAGVVIFSVYTLAKGFSFRELLSMMAKGIRTAKNVLIALVLIGMMTALWRGSGTIPTIVTYSSKLISPGIFLLAAFLLNSLVAFLMGTSLGTAATMGVICVTVGRTMGIDPFFVGGAVLSGTYFGDRCSPVSTSALLVSTITETDLYDNIKKMFRTAAVPFAATCVIYLILGAVIPASGAQSDVGAMFSGEFTIHAAALIPAVLILVLALFRVNVKISMSVSIVSAFILSLALQHRAPLDVLRSMVFGFVSKDETIASMVNGGGITSMLKVIGIICCSLAFSGIFEKTGITDSFRGAVKKLSGKISVYGAAIVVSFITSAVGSNQTLAVMLTDQLCSELEKDNTKRALMYENTAILIAAIIPWSTASSVALTAATAPISSISLAFFLFLVPLWNFLYELLRNKRKKHSVNVT